MLKIHPDHTKPPRYFPPALNTQVKRKAKLQHINHDITSEVAKKNKDFVASNIYFTANFS